ncbi:hypothetical protein [Microcella alkalica]|uniref:hypothetical protein n=1 Tax=Microcella alkalica TaxID=355930 RepID=UPI00145E2650|nr:hypothetical protein [Microcella alkalica]
MIVQYSPELARRVNLSTALALQDDLDYDFAPHPAPRRAAAVAYFSEWDLDLPSARCHCADDVPPIAS